MTVMIDIKMPKTCETCRFALYRHSWNGKCCATEEFKEIPYDKPDWCPLQEVKGGKDGTKD